MKDMARIRQPAVVTHPNMIKRLVVEINDESDLVIGYDSTAYETPFT